MLDDDAIAGREIACFPRRILCVDGADQVAVASEDAGRTMVTAKPSRLIVTRLPAAVRPINANLQGASVCCRWTAGADQAKLDQSYQLRLTRPALMGMRDD